MIPMRKTMWETPDGRTFPSEGQAIDWWEHQRRQKEWEKYLRGKWLNSGANYRIHDMIDYHQEIHDKLKEIYST